MKPGQTATVVMVPAMLNSFPNYDSSFTPFPRRIRFLEPFETVVLLEYVPKEAVGYPPERVVTYGFWKVLTRDGKVGYVVVCKNERSGA